MKKKAKAKKAPKQKVTMDDAIDAEKDKAIREMGEASRKYGCGLAQPSVTLTIQSEGCCSPPLQVSEKTGDKESDDILKKINDAINAGPVSLTVKVKTSSKSGYYWQYWDGEQTPGSGPVFAITPKAYFDEHGCLDDSHFEGETNDIPEGFSNLMESMFEFEGTREQAEGILRANPLFEEKGIIHVEDEGEEA